MNAEQRIFAWLERADFDGTGCRWSQENIAAACGCSRRTVIRATQKLAAEGRIDSFLERRPGCKWPCRVYRVKHWNPHKRAGVLNVLRSIQERRSSQCHTERTAKPPRAQTTPQDATSHRCSGSSTAVVARPKSENEGSPTTGASPRSPKGKGCTPDMNERTEMQRTIDELHIKVGDDKTPLTISGPAVEAVQHEAGTIADTAIRNVVDAWEKTRGHS